jgi:hypothetical protein
MSCIELNTSSEIILSIIEIVTLLNICMSAKDFNDLFSGADIKSVYKRADYFTPSNAEVIWELRGCV